MTIWKPGFSDSIVVAFIIFQKIQCDKVCILKLILLVKLAYMYARQILKKISEKVVVMINKDWRRGGDFRICGGHNCYDGAYSSHVPPIRENLFLYVSLNMRE